MAERRCLVGLIGSGIGPSLSPALHEREADRQGIRYLYQLIDLDVLGLGVGDLGELLRDARRLGFRGVNVTHPCKQAVVEHLDEVSAAAAAVGAVNTVTFDAGRAAGHNTDVYGFEQNLARRLPGARLERVVLLGAGGAGAAVATALLGLGAGHLTIVDTEPARVDQLVARLGARAEGAAPDELASRLAGADGLVNATPVGMTAHPGLPLPAALLRPDLWVADIVYFPLDTALLRGARRVGCRTLDGGGMAVFQAAGAFEIFTGLRPDADRMLAHFHELIGSG